MKNIALVSLVLLGLLSSSSCPQNKENNKKPNILVIMADDCTFNDIALYGGKNVKTPNINKLASESLIFNKAYVSMAMCTPSRAEFFTGKYPANNGVVVNHGKAKAEVKSISHYLGELGYKTGIAGKIHVKPESVFSFQKIPGIEHRSVAKTSEYDASGMKTFIEGDEPFCLLNTLTTPHVPWTVGDASNFDEGKLILPPTMADTKKTRKAYASYLAEIEVLDQQVGMTLQMLEDSGKADNTIVIFTTEQGSQFPFNKWTNYDTGVHTGFLVRWPNKIKPGSRTNALIQYADVLPTLIEAVGGKVKKNSFDGKSFLRVLTKGEKSHRKYVYAMHNNLPEGPPYRIRSISNGDYRYIRNLDHSNIYIEKHLMTGMANNKYWDSWIFRSGSDSTVYNLVRRYMLRPQEELYHTSDDPFEQTNLSENSDYKRIKTELSEELLLWIKNESGLKEESYFHNGNNTHD